jgi:LacI family transcriptional regulator
VSVTLKDIANELGISKTTVSNALNKTPSARIAYETRQKVLEAADRLGYTRNRHALALTTGKSQIVAVLASWSRVEARIVLLAHIEALLRARGYRPLVRSVGWDEGEHREILQEITGVRVEGIISLIEDPWSDLLEYFANSPQNIPIVANCPMDDGKADQVLTDRRWGSYMAVKHLLDQGHRRIIAHVYHDLSDAPLYREKYQGFVKAHKQYGIPIDPSLHMPPKGKSIEAVLEHAHMTGLELTKGETGATAILCNSDVIAFAVMRGLLEGGYRIPEDMAVAGFDNMTGSAYAAVPLTTIEYPTLATAEKLVEFLCERIDNPESAIPQRVIRLKPKLIIRESTVKSSQHRCFSP